jgi:hypothetical protein
LTLRKEKHVGIDDFGWDSYTREGMIDVFLLDRVKHSTIVFKEQVAGGTSAFDFFEKD